MSGVAWLWRNYEGRIYVPDHWKLHFSPCCEYHRFRVHIGPFIWRWSA